MLKKFLKRWQIRKDDRTRKFIAKYKKAHVNKPCPCGSGIKYKKCCKNAIEQLQAELKY